MFQKFRNWLTKPSRVPVPLFPPPTTKTYPDPVLKKDRPRKKKTRPRLECTPGTIRYQDALVRHLGYDRRRADALLRDWREHGTPLPILSEDQR